ncbi:MAG: efflux RND transporter periplasmic adaptor subunit [Desulfuromonadales bacterium]|nr:efflux RND transporter periplasmic adaptor subunit [Desulfuromonadales bacterium]
MAAVTLSLTVSGCEKKSVAAPPAQRPAPEVSVITVQPEQVTLTTELAGRTSPYRVAEVRPQVGGIIQQRLFTEGSDVEVGAVLYQIDPATFEAAYANAKAALVRAEANLYPARLKEERFRKLVKINAVSQQDYDDAAAAIKQAEAEVEAARAALQTARINLNYTRMTAPVSGRIGRSAVTTGALVTAGQGAPLATIQQLDPIYVDVTQSIPDLLRLKQNVADGLMKKPGTEPLVRLFLEDGRAYPLPGQLKFSDVTVNQSTGSVTLRSIFPNPEQLLLPGMFVRAVIEEGIYEQAILVPQRGVTRNPSGAATVMLVDANEQIAVRVIKLGRNVGEKWLVKEGLQAGDRVVLEGTQKVRPGVQVNAVPFVATAAASQTKSPTSPR